MSQAKKWPQYLAALSATISAIAVGTVLPWTSPASEPLRDGSYLDGYKVSEEEESWIGGLVPLGAACACSFIGFFVDRFGRKTTMLLLVIPFLIGWALVIWPTGVVMLYIGRFILGMEVGAYSVALPFYTTEVAEDEIRGALGGFFEACVVFGIAFVYALGTGVPLFTISVISAIIPIIFAAIFFFMPESPLYYVYKNRDEDARKSLQFLRGKDFDIEPELTKMREFVNMSANQTTPIWQNFNTRAAKRGMFISIGLMMAQQLCGVNALTFYTSSIFKEAHSDLDPSIASLIFGVVQWSGAVISTFLVDRWGRRVLLFISAYPVFLGNLLLGVYFYFQDEGSDMSSFTWFPLTCLPIYIFVTELGYGPIPFMILGELFQPHIQGAAGSIAVLLNWGLVFIVTKFFNNLNSALGEGGTFFLFAAMSGLSIFFIYFAVIETKGRSMEDIQEELEGKKKVKKSKEEEAEDVK